ncbi:MAG TPA: hypothetical protein VFB25_05115 [Gaiellaceae bacterium]|nr:hypothetical protein [Gaiellaceae bacterium]
MAETEMCWRCPTPMAWVHGTWQCPRCKFKLGCCEGDPQTPCDVPAKVEPWRSSTHAS